MGFNLVLFHETGSVVMTSLPAPGYGYSTTRIPIKRSITKKMLKMAHNFELLDIFWNSAKTLTKACSFTGDEARCQ